MNEPNLKLINSFLEKDNCELFDMKRQWLDIENSLERELYFKRKCCKVPDPDECELTMSIACILLKGNGFDVVGYSGRHVILGNGEKIETDTAHSFISLYKGALMTCLPNYLELLKQFDIKGSFTKEYEKIYFHRGLFNLYGIDKELFELFDQFANLTHCIGNFVFGPVGFNCADKKSKAKILPAKNWSLFDRMDIFMDKIANDEIYDSWKEWYSNYMKNTYTYYFYDEIVYNGDGTVNFRDSKLIDLGNTDIKKRIETINAIIRCRGEKMVCDLKQYMRDSIWI